MLEVEVYGAEALGQEGLGKEELGQEGLGKEGLGREELGQERLGKEGLGREELGQGGFRQGMLGKEALGKEAPSAAQVRRLCILAAATAGVDDGHVAIEFVAAGRIARLNAEHRGRNAPTDVLSFPVDGAVALEGGPRELGDVVICPEHTEDLREAIVHGVLHLVGMDHETDGGEMLAVQAELLRWELLPASAGS